MVAVLVLHSILQKKKKESEDVKTYDILFEDNKQPLLNFEV